MLRPGGRLMIEANNLTELLPRWLPSTVIERDGDLAVDRAYFDPVTGLATTDRMVVRGGATRRFRYSVRMFMAVELGAWLREAGFSAIEFRGRAGEGLTAQSRRMIAIAARGVTAQARASRRAPPAASTASRPLRPTPTALAKPWNRPAWHCSAAANAGRAQSQRVLLTVVSQGIEAGGGNERRRDPGELGGQQRRAARIAHMRELVKVLARVPVEIVLAQVEALTEQGIGPTLAGEIEPRIEQQLQGRSGPPGPDGMLGHPGGQVTPGAVAAHGERARDRRPVPRRGSAANANAVHASCAAAGKRCSGARR